MFIVVFTDYTDFSSISLGERKEHATSIAVYFEITKVVSE